MKFIPVLLISGCVALGQAFTFSDIPFMAQTPPVVSGNAPMILFLTNLSTTANNAYHQTPDFTPASNAFLIANMWIDTLAAIGSVTNTGTTNLTWWRAAGNSIGSVAQGAIYVTQLPIGTAPFNMAVGVTAANNPAGAEIHVWQVTNASTTQLWGTNAVVQTTNTAGQTTGQPYQFFFTQPTTSGNTSFVAVYANTGTDTTYEPTWVLGLHTGHTTPTHELDSVYYTNTASIASMFTTNSGNRSQSFMEIRK